MRRTSGIFYRATDGEGRVALARLAIDALCKLCDAAGRDRMDREYRATIRGQFVVVMAARNIDCDLREGKITEASALDRLCEMFSAARVCGDDEASRCYSDALEARAALRQAGG